MFSATLSPMEHYAQLLGLNERGGDALLDLPSPFPHSRTFLPIAHEPAHALFGARGNGGARGPGDLSMARARRGQLSPVFLLMAYLKWWGRFSPPYPDVRVIVQRGEMAEEERDAFLAQFSCAPRASMVAFIVMGGVFAEGVDLPGERLSGAGGHRRVHAADELERDTLLRWWRMGRGGFAMAYAIS